MHSWQQSQKHKARSGRRTPDGTGGPTHPSIHLQQPYKQLGEERRRRIAHSRAASVSLFACACDAGQHRAAHEGPPRELRWWRRRPLRRLPLLHGLHVAVRRVRRRPQREEGAGAGRPLVLLVLCRRRRHDRHHGGPGFIRRRRRRRGREGEAGRGGGDAGARGGRGVEADEGDPEPVADVRDVRRRRGGGAGDSDRVPHGRAARGAHRLGRPQQHGGRRRRHGEHGERLQPALLPLPPPPRHGHGPPRRARLRLNLTASSSDEGYLVPPPPPAGTVVVVASRKNPPLIALVLVDTRRRN